MLLSSDLVWFELVQVLFLLSETLSVPMCISHIVPGRHWFLDVICHLPLALMSSYVSSSTMDANPRKILYSGFVTQAWPGSVGE